MEKKWNESHTPSQPANQAKQSRKTKKQTTIQKMQKRKKKRTRKNKLHHSLINYFLCCSRCISIRFTATTAATTLRKPLFHPFLMLSIPKVDLEIVHGHTRAGRI